MRIPVKPGKLDPPVSVVLPIGREYVAAVRKALRI